MFNQAYASSTLPIAGTDIAVEWNSLYAFVMGLSIFFFVLVVGGMIYFMIKYKHRPGQMTEYHRDSNLLEGIWIGVPTALLMIIFVWGYSVYHSMRQAPSDSYEVRVIGKQWLWTFQYENGRTTVGELFVPMNKPVKLVMTSEDVLHGFFIPNFRIKQDVVPGMYTSIWFTATVPGKHQVFCTEYCGTSHSQMLAQVVVLNEEQWETWNNNKQLGNIPKAGVELASDDKISSSAASPMKPLFSLVEQGKIVHESKGCIACHTVDGSVKVGPSHKGMFGSKVELTNGKFAIADENFIRSHIENPRSVTLKGYSDVMPTFKGLITEVEMNALIAYMKSLK
jgi:cytochrome c oxidase subunit 2